MKEGKKVILMILDGWGIGDGTKRDAISQASTPNMDALLAKYPHSRLLTSGENVGLPEGQMGNSEVGHLNIGAGRVVYQDLVRINKEIRENKIDHNEELLKAFEYVKAHGKRLHFLGLVSDGGVHSSDKHLYKLCDMAKDHGINDVFIHALTDGRDTDPRSGLGFLRSLHEHLNNSAGQIASITGRYYTMDRDKRWERIKIGYDAIVSGVGAPAGDMLAAVQTSYDEGITDEFINPIIKVDAEGLPVGNIREGDCVICFNFRTDRLREITVALTQKDMPEFGMKIIPLYYLTMTRYDDTFKNVKVIYSKDNVDNTLGEVIEKNGLKQIRIAETEKYAHVTFFFSGGREEVFSNEKRILIPSPKVATYDLQPEMSAPLVTDAIVSELENRTADFICLNFANCDMVGHTGIYPAITKAVETVDACVGRVISAAQKGDYEAIIIADHGNADNAVNPDGSPNTAHSLNPVPCLVVSERVAQVREGILADIAPTVLSLMGIEIPKEMTGKVLTEFK
ncbi:MAG: 2,3-bisphosphoglycerate-independent phosphoglycerate mutase [Chloroflexota bacterium]